jgi:hypothetical protein
MEGLDRILMHGGMMNEAAMLDGERMHDCSADMYEAFRCIDLAGRQLRSAR